MTDQQNAMTDLENVGKSTLLELADMSNDLSVSITMPTHQRGKEVNEGQDMIMFKNHLQRIRQTLESRDLRSNDVNDLLQPLEALLDDTQFWRHQQQGLAVFRNPKYFGVFHSPLPLADNSEVSTQFRLGALLPFSHRSPSYYLLQISKNGIKLFKADSYSITPINTTSADADPTDTMPSGLEAVTKYYEFEEQFQSYSSGGGSGGGSVAMYQSDNLDNKEKDHLLADYFRLVDKNMIDIIGTQNLPLVLASVAYFQPIYREINTYPHLYDEGLTGNFDHTQPDELHQMAQALVGDSFEQEKQRRIEQYQNNSGGELVSSDAKELLKAAVTGRIETLFVKAGAELWGKLDEDNLKATIHSERQDGDEDLADKAAMLTLHNGGYLYVMDEINLLDNQDSPMMTAFFRF